ncbi:MAG: alanine--tRNA ligase, partial [Lachnospiraceae bacterium]|nr:alanine--tRNA ligase [Lachnospiraceae bacterium]
PKDLGRKLSQMMEEIKALKAENDKLKTELAGNSLGDAADNAVDLGGVKMLCLKAEAADVNALRSLSDTLADKLGDCVIVLGAEIGGKATLIASATDGAVKRGAMAGNIIKEIAPVVGGKGGGRPTMAQAGGPDVAAIEAALAKAAEVIKSQIK